MPGLREHEPGLTAQHREPPGEPLMLVVNPPVGRFFVYLGMHREEPRRQLRGPATVKNLKGDIGFSHSQIVPVT